MLHYLTEKEKHASSTMLRHSPFSDDELREYALRYPVGPEGDSLEAALKAFARSDYGWIMLLTIVGGPYGFFGGTVVSMLMNNIEDNR